MADWVVPNEGKIEWLARALGSTGLNAESYTVKLYKNNYTPVDASTGSDFTECDFTGYSSVVVTRSSWPFPSIVSNVAQSVNTGVDFTCTGGSSQTAYGCYIIGTSTGKVLLAALFDTPRVMSSGATETVTPEVKLKTFV